MSLNVNDLLKLLLDLYNTSTVPVRFSYIYWVIFIALYVMLYSYEQKQDLVKRRTTRIANYHGTLYLFGGIAILMHHGSIYAQWSFLSPIIQEGANELWMDITGFVIMGFGLYLVAAARIELNGYWGQHKSIPILK